MKKLLLNYKTLNFAIVLFLLGANSMFSQTVFEETFGTAALPAPFIGSTSSPSVTYTQTSNGSFSTVLNGSDAFLNITSSGAAGRPNLTAPFTSVAPGLNPILTNNTNLITWSVNMRVSRAMSSSSNTYSDNSYYLAVVLCSSNADLISGTNSNTDGYALILQRSLDNPTSINPGAVRLVKFHNGIGSSAAGSSVSAALLSTPALNSGAVASATAPNNVSIKVVYNPNFDSWQLFYREDPTTAPITFADPSIGTFTSAGTAVVDATYTSTPMTHFGFLGSFSTSTSASNQFQLDNFKIQLDTPPAYTPPPTVEKRQAFNSTINPTVANLIATGTNVKWYSSATGGIALNSSTPLTYSTYYVTQTLAGTESERVSSAVFVGDTSTRTLPFYENFGNYNVNDKLIVINNDGLSGTGLGAWSVNTETTTPLSPDDILIAAQPTSWASSLLPNPTGNALVFDKSGLDPQLLFNAPTTGSVYASCMFMVTNLNAITNVSVTTPLGTTPETYVAPGHFFSLGYSAGAGLPTAYTAAVYLKTSSTNSTQFNIGINATPGTTIVANDIIWDSADYSINAPITIVTNYSYDNLISKLWINPTSNSIEPIANATTLPRTTALAVDRVRLTQQSSASTPFITLDEIRVADNWGQALGGAATLGLVNNSVSNLTLYPNPVSNGKLFISSSSNLEKEVAIYTTLGQQVLQDKTVSEAINVSNLSQGTYFVKITEAGLTTTKKLIIK
jgi:hypothetical protein